LILITMILKTFLNCSKRFSKRFLVEISSPLWLYSETYHQKSIYL
jgi:hypothetical protein